MNSFIEDTGLTGVVVRQPREMDADARMAVRARLPTMGVAPPVLCPGPWPGMGKQGLKVWPLPQDIGQETPNYGLMVSSAIFQKGKGAESRLEISRVLLGGSGIALNGKTKWIPTVRGIKIQFSAPGDLLILLAYA